MFEDRFDAGRRLAARLLHFKGGHPVVLALPRGGVPVAFEVARALDAALDLILVRKIGAPGQEEFGIGAVCDGPAPVVVVDQATTQMLGVSAHYIDGEIKRQLAEIERRRLLWLGERPRAEVAGHTVIVVDDGIATGGTMRAGLMSLRRQKPKRLIMAVPVAPADALQQFRDEVDQIVCLSTPDFFGAVGQFYRDFRQVADDEVAELLHQADAFGKPPAAEAG